tara:strand:+ start:1132 stop:1395 length:264 start_codon:yes stop_codon:yes gene_type:complete
MAIFSVEIDDNDVGRVITSLCVNFGRQESVFNPETGEEEVNTEDPSIFANKVVRQFLANNVVKYETDLARKQISDGITAPTINDPQL